VARVASEAPLLHSEAIHQVGCSPERNDKSRWFFSASGDAPEINGL
jgi:hypothetical protein